MSALWGAANGYRVTMADSDSIVTGAIHALAIAQAATHVTFIQIMVRQLDISPVEIRHALQATRDEWVAYDSATPRRLGRYSG